MSDNAYFEKQELIDALQKPTDGGGYLWPETRNGETHIVGRLGSGGGAYVGLSHISGSTRICLGCEACEKRNANGKMYTPAEAADYLDVSVSTLNKLVREGKLHREAKATFLGGDLEATLIEMEGEREAAWERRG